MQRSKTPRLLDPERALNESLSTRNNSLNFLRLVLASTVLLSHAAGLAADKNWVVYFNGTSAAQIALYGFFALSGYLVAQSAARSKPFSYLWKRTLRIFPGLIGCLIITAFGFGIIYWFHGNHPCGLSCYFHSKDSPVKYVIKNALLANPFWVQHTISGTPVSYIPAWNASLWTLFYEFSCYLIVMVLSIIGFLRRRIFTLIITVALWLTVTVITVTPSFSIHFNFFVYISIEDILRFGVIFLTGSTMYLYRDRVPDSGWLAIGSAGIYILGILFPIWTVGTVPTLEFTPIDIATPFIVYPLLWLGVHLPFRGVGQRNDYSYGIYIYGWPITQLLIMWDLHRHGVVTFEVLALGATIPFAAASWWLIERPSLMLKNWKIPSLRKPRSNDTGNEDRVIERASSTP